jgi:hypothetical protein
MNLSRSNDQQKLITTINHYAEFPFRISIFTLIQLEQGIYKKFELKNIEERFAAQLLQKSINNIRKEIKLADNQLEKSRQESKHIRTLLVKNKDKPTQSATASDFNSNFPQLFNHVVTKTMLTDHQKHIIHLIERYQQTPYRASFITINKLSNEVQQLFDPIIFSALYTYLSDSIMYIKIDLSLIILSTEEKNADKCRIALNYLLFLFEKLRKSYNKRVFEYFLQEIRSAEPMALIIMQSDPLFAKRSFKILNIFAPYNHLFIPKMLTNNPHELTYYIDHKFKIQS